MEEENYDKVRSQLDNDDNKIYSNSANDNIKSEKCNEGTASKTMCNNDVDGKKIPINVGFGGMLYLTQTLPNYYFNCGNQTLSTLNFQLRNSAGDIIRLPSHLSFSIILLRANE